MIFPNSIAAGRKQVSFFLSKKRRDPAKYASAYWQHLKYAPEEKNHVKEHASGKKVDRSLPTGMQ